MSQLSEQAIRAHLGRLSLQQQLDVYCLDAIDSTNRFLKDLDPVAGLSICCAESQSNGRGRLNRSWYSPAGENIYLSTRQTLYSQPQHLPSLGLVVSLAIVAALNRLTLNEPLLIKWPNDILWRHRKLCGCLIELLSIEEHCCEVIIGIGLNVNTKTSEHILPLKPWCSLFDICGRYLDRNMLIGDIIQSLQIYLDNWSTQGFGFFLNQWRSVDALFGETITVTQASHQYQGLACGVNALGELILNSPTGETHHISSGEASILLHHSKVNRR